MTTKSQVLVIINDLLETTVDKNEKVRNTVYSSLKKIATFSCTSLVLTAVIDYRQKNAKLSNHDIRNRYNLVKEICEEKLEEIDYSLMLKIIDCATEECVKYDNIPFIAADILTIVSLKYSEEIYKRISDFIEGRNTPHSPIIYAIGNISARNAEIYLPFSRTVFQYFASILLSIKTDNVRKSYATTIHQLILNVIEHFSEEKTCVERKEFSVIIEEIYDVFISVWLQTKNNEVYEAVVKAIGSMILLFSIQKLCSDAGRILNMFLSLYKKPPPIPRFIITQGISNFLSVVPRSAIQPSIDNLLYALHVMVWITPDFSQPLTVRNHNELLRCYDHIGALFSEKLCETILRNLRSNSEQDKVVALIVATHLLNSNEQILKPKITEMISVLHSILNESSIKIKTNLIRIITALAYRQYLSEKDISFIEFIAKHSYQNSNDSDSEELESMCRNTIYLLSTSVPAIQNLCWKVLLQILTSGKHNQAAAVVSKSLAYLVSKCDTAILETSYLEHSEVVFVHVVTLLGSPLHENRGIHLLNFLNVYVLWKIKVDIYLWKHKISTLLVYLENTNTEWCDAKWENFLLDLLCSVFVEEANPWLVSVNKEILNLLTEYEKNNELSQFAPVNNNNIAIDERAMLYKMLAVFTRYLQDEQDINTNINKILFPLYQRSLLHLKACSRCVGILSKTNFTQIFKQLEVVQQTELSRKTTKFLGLLKNTKNENDVEIVRRMICECYLSVVVETPFRILSPKLSYLINLFITQMQVTKDSQSKNICCDAVFKISEILYTHEEDTYENNEECRNRLCTFILNLIEQEKSMPNITILRTMTILFKLVTTWSSTDKLHLVQKCLNKLFQYYSATILIPLENNQTNIVNQDPVIQQLDLLIKETTNVENSLVVLEELVHFLQPWLSHRQLNHRLISVFLLKSVLQNYLEHNANDLKSCDKFNYIGSLLSRTCIRSFEENAELQMLARQCIVLLLMIADRIVSIDDIKNVISNAGNLDIESVLMPICCKLAPEQLSVFFENLINGLLDTENLCSLGAAQMLKKIFTDNGSQHQRQVSESFNAMLLNLVKIENESMQIACIEAILALARHRMEMFVSIMLTQSLPFHSNVCLCWQNVSEDEEFSDQIIKYFLEIIEINPSYENIGQNRRKISTRPIAIVLALKNIANSKISNKLIKYYFADLFSTLLMMIPVYVGEEIYLDNSSKIATIYNRDVTNILIPAQLIFETLCTIMKGAECKEIDELLYPFCSKIEFKKVNKLTVYFQMISTIPKCISHFDTEYILSILQCLNKYTEEDKTENQRTTVIFLYTEVCIVNLFVLITEIAKNLLKIKRDGNESTLINTIIMYLLKLLNDSSPIVREFILQGLSSVCELELITTDRFKEDLLTALIKGLDDDEAIAQPGIIIHSLTGLSKLLRTLNTNNYSSLLLSIAIRIKPFFEKENVEIRSLSLKLFGELAHTCVADLPTFHDQIKRNFLCLLFHLAEKEASVIQTCKFSLRIICPLLKSDKLFSMITKHLIDDANLYYKEYLHKITELLVEEFPELCYDFIMMSLTYCKSTWPEIKAAAAFLIGVIYSSQTEKSKKYLEKLSVDTVSSKLLTLLKDVDVDVRISAATSLSLLITATFQNVSETDENS